ncbi:MAG: hypothetical protein JWM82_1665 [Myxococcales bacterium]|nr:hypothetical protein [Myxococcales bacterium]
MMRRKSTMAPTVVVAVLLSLGACQGVPSGASPADTGSVRMALTSSASGASYRLHAARFAVDGPTVTTLDSDLQPDATVLTTTLSTGSYGIALRDGWELQRLDAGAYATVQATLISANPVPFHIDAGATTDVAFQFSTSGQVITVGTGSLDVCIQVFADAATPVPVAGGGCVDLKIVNPLGWCTVDIAGNAPTAATVQTVCVPPGVVLVMAQPNPGFTLGARPWHDTVGDTGSGDPGTGATGQRSTTVQVGPGGACAWVCCDFSPGGGCPTADQCP